MSDDQKTPDPQRQRTGQLGGLTRWSNATRRGDREQQIGKIRGASPADDSYWAVRLGFDPDAAMWTPQQVREISTEKKLYFSQLRSRSVVTIKNNKAARLRALAEKLEAEAREVGA